MNRNSLNEALRTGYKTLPLNKAFLERSNNTFKFLIKTPEETKVFTLGDFLGGGSYGKTYTINEQIHINEDYERLGRFQ